MVGVALLHVKQKRPIAVEWIRWIAVQPIPTNQRFGFDDGAFPIEPEVEFPPGFGNDGLVPGTRASFD
jgi:hypothetical protein